MTMRPARWLLFWAALLATDGLLAESAATALEASEAGVKGAYLYKFAGYVEWPPVAVGAAVAPFTIGVAGADEVAAELERIVPGRTLHGHRAVVRRVGEGEATAGLQMLFVGRGGDVQAILRREQHPGLLVVTDNERGLELGSAINFVLAAEHVGFEVSVEAAERNGLRISSRMLNVARRVVTRP